MAEPDDDPDDDPNEESGLNERLLDLFVFVPVGVALSVVEEIPRLAARGREQLGVQVSSARAVGQFAVKVGLRRSEALSRRFGAGGRSGRPSRKPSAVTRPPVGAVRADETPPGRTPFGQGRGGSVPPGQPATGGVNGHVPPVAALSIPGFDALSASQVVQRLDGLNRTELVSVRTYEASTRGRRTILNRVDQLLDERS